MQYASFTRRGILVIGRAPECELHLADRKVSRRHAILVLGRDSLIVQDDDSPVAHLRAGARPEPRSQPRSFVELRQPRRGGGQQFGAQVRHGREEGRPVLADLRLPGEGAAGVGRLLALVPGGPGVGSACHAD